MPRVGGGGGIAIYKKEGDLIKDLFFTMVMALFDSHMVT